jgi:hypothetical protein
VKGPQIENNYSDPTGLSSDWSLDSSPKLKGNNGFGIDGPSTYCLNSAAIASGNTDMVRGEISNRWVYNKSKPLGTAGWGGC